jgi:hypothetical protein
MGSLFGGYCAEPFSILSPGETCQSKKGVVEICFVLFGVRGCVSAIDSNGRKIWIADAHRGARKRFVVRADEKLTGFLELESATDSQNPAHAGATAVQIVLIAITVR